MDLTVHGLRGYEVMKSADGSLVDGTIRGVAKATREERNDRIVVDGVGLLMEAVAADVATFERYRAW